MLIRIPSYFIIVNMIAVLLLAATPFILFGVYAEESNTWKISIEQGASDENPSRVFYPDTLPVKIGDTVIWENNDTIVHNIASGVPDFPEDAGFFFQTNEIKPGEHSGIILENDAYDAFYYLCTIHPWMTGKIFYSDKPGAQPDTEYPLVLDKEKYQNGETIEFSGKVIQNFHGIDYQILIFNEENLLVDSVTGYFDDNAEYKDNFVIKDLPIGKYFTHLVYGIPSTVAQNNFEVSESGGNSASDFFEILMKNFQEFWVQAITFLYA